MLTLLFLLPALFLQTDASGLLEIRLKSAHDQEATMVLATDEDPMYLALPVNLAKNKESTFGDLLVDLNKTYTVTIRLDKTDELGLAESVYKGMIQPIRGSLSPRKLNLPLNGMMFSFKCEENWSGELCDEPCKGECSKVGKTTQNDVHFDVEYLVNPQKLDNIMEMLKKENETPNVFTIEQQEEDKTLLQIMEASGEASGEQPE